MIHERPDGIVLRTATPDDVDEIVALSIDAHGSKHEWGFRTVMADPTAGLERWVVATDGDCIVSTLCLMEEAFRIGGPEGVVVPVGRPEYVATLPEYRRRRLIRDQLDVVHRWSAERGDLVQMILGIHYFYRRFGYEYGADYLHFWSLTPTAELTTPEGWSVRRATKADIDDLRRLHDESSAAAGVSLVYTDRHWDQVVDEDPLHVLRAMIAESDSGLKAFAYVLREKEDEPARMAHVCGDRLDGVRALTAWAKEEAAGQGVAIANRPGTLCEAFLLDHARPAPKTSAAYLRIADPVAFLDRIRPVLSVRLAESPLCHERGELVISLYATGIRLTYEDGTVVAVEACPGIEEPDEEGAVGIPPDHFVALAMGRWGALELERRQQDVDLGSCRALMATLFPPLVADLATAI